SVEYKCGLLLLIPTLCLFWVLHILESQVLRLPMDRGAPDATRKTPWKHITKTGFLSFGYRYCGYGIERSDCAQRECRFLWLHKKRHNRRLWLVLYVGRGGVFGVCFFVG